MLQIEPLFSNLTEFKEFILDAYEQKLKAAGKIPQNAVLTIADINLYTQSAIVEECLQELGIEDINTYFESIDDLKNVQTSNGQFGTFELDQDGQINQNSNFILEYLNDFFKQDNIKNLANKNGDGDLTQEEMLDFLATMNHYDGDESNLSLQDLLSAADFFGKLANDNALEALALPNANSANAANPFRGGGSTTVPETVEAPKYDSSNNPILENWSVDELKKELTTQENKLNGVINAMDSAINGSDSRSQQLQNQENLAHQKLEEYKQSHNNELSQKLTEFDQKTADVKAAENNVFQNEADIIRAADLLAQKETELTNATTFKAGLETSLSTLENQLAQAKGQPQENSGAGQGGAAEIQSKISQAKAQIAKAQSAIQTAQKARDEAKTQKEAFEAKREGFSAALTVAQGALSVVEEQMKGLEGYSEIEEFLRSYNQARKQTTDYKAAAIVSARTAVKQQRASIDKLKTEISNRELKQAQTDVSYNPTAMDDVVKYFGEDYISLLSQEEILALQKQIARTGMSNNRDMPSQCLQCGTMYMQWIEGRNGQYASTFSFQKEKILEGIKSTLDSGRSTNIMVTTKAGSRHFVTVIGYKKGAGDKLKESDLLVVDTWSGEIDGMGGSGGVAGNYRTLYAQDKGYRYDILSNKYTWKIV